jgi:uncharacterized protein
MKRGLDLDKAEAALKRAAEKATHGTREERSGRFRPKGDITEPLTEPFKDVVQAVLTVMHPAAIILVGSQARGDTHKGSDLDLLIIREQDFKPGESRRKELGSLYRAISKTCDLPKDVLLFTKNEFLNWKYTTNHMVSLACKEGRVLYGEI